MKLSYRGVEYDYNSPLVSTAMGDRGKYRGVDIRFRVPAQRPDQRHQPTLDLIYRGAHYQG